MAFFGYKGRMYVCMYVCITLPLPLAVAIKIWVKATSLKDVPTVAKDGQMWASLGPSDSNPGVMLNQILPLRWDHNQANAIDILEAIAKR
eukprot:5393972-Heterocapsa_arctica.AAC.1